MSWLAWLFRSAERARAYERLRLIREAYAEQGDRIIRLSARTDLLRKTAGSTQRSFEHVEKSFVTATMEYARAGHLIDSLEQVLTKGKTGDPAGVEKAVRAIAPLLDDLDRHLTKWESRWEQVPQELDEAERGLADLRRQADAAAASLEASLPFQRALSNLDAFLDKARSTLESGDPIEAGHLLDDLEIARKKVATEVGLYVSGLGAVQQVEQGLSRIRAAIGDGPGELTAETFGALASAEALLPRLRPALSDGNFERFQADLLEIQRHLASVRVSSRTS